MATMEDVIELARLHLNDEDKVRHFDADLLLFASNYIQEAIKERPDLFIGSFQRLPDYSLKLSDTFPMPIRYVRSCADYVIARVNMKNTEEGSFNIASSFFNLSAKAGGV
jgi:hypothetical protein